MLGICFHYDEVCHDHIPPVNPQAWYRLCENWQVDLLIMIDSTEKGGLHWLENHVPQQPYKMPVVRYTSLKDAMDEQRNHWVLLEQKKMQPTRSQIPAVQLPLYDHPEDAIYCFGGDMSAGIRGVTYENCDWVYLPINIEAFAVQVASAALYDRHVKGRKDNKLHRLEGEKMDLRKKLNEALHRETLLKRKLAV